MANTFDLKLVLKHLSNGTLGENLCISCLKPLRDQYENIFTKVCKYDKEYCIADVLQIMFNVTLSATENYNVCKNCFMMASMAYKFYLLSKRSQEILNFYADELLSNIDQIELSDEPITNTLCISLPKILTKTPNFDFNLHAIGKKSKTDPEEKTIKTEITQVSVKKEITEQDIKNSNIQQKDAKVDEDDVVVIIQDNGEPLFYRVHPDGILELLQKNEMEKYMKTFKASLEDFPEKKPTRRTRKRMPMSYTFCTRCPVKYRFIAKLKDHMRKKHNVTLYVCKVCKAMTEDEHEYNSHTKTHTNVHQCDMCNTVFKKRSTIIRHLKWHDRMKNISKTANAHICEICGVILENEDSLRQHYDNKHYKKFTCYYCGRMYKGEISFNLHIKKHEANLEAGGKRHKPPNPKKKQTDATTEDQNAINKKKCMCSTCGRYFVDERALLWHQRLHNNERPYICDVCGRGFISLNRRNQHALCAHTAPARRCPLCPALFHLRSMVNTHIKKVHLKDHKRRNRVSKHQNVYWRTEPVPIQELSVDIQNEILELQQAARQEQEWTHMETAPPEPMEGI